MQFCTRCLYPSNHPLHLTFDEEGVCSGCRIHEEKDCLDWNERSEKLRAIVKEFKSPDQKRHDCIVPVDGGRDSYFTVHVVKNLLGLNPLLVSYNKHWNTALGIRNLAYMRIAFNCDMIQKTVNPNTLRALNLASLEAFGSIYWHILAGHTAFPVQSAINYRIPLIIWGAHQGIDQVGMFSHTEEVEMTRRYRKDHDLMGFELEDLVQKYPELDQHNLDSFLYPDSIDIANVGVRGIYLNNYIRWDSKKQHELMIDTYNYETTPQVRVFDNYHDVNCHHYNGLHDRIKFAKLGYGKVTDQACREIRLKRMDRKQALELVEKHQHRDTKDEDLFLEWQGISSGELWSYIDQHRDPRAWEKVGSKWHLKHAPIVDGNDNSFSCSYDVDYRVTPSRAPGEDKNTYVLIGKGYVEGQKPSSPPVFDKSGAEA
ncbi:N-acetyl sugar amidotransferase [Thalassospira sp. HF15]|uniref:N-acetyl sugar amidotransferase n=1 Tax=Thalassospira sp. HF15 TaxID=2722755 RepID=UPI0014306333|nr:N-acetyl sugar amidotransferase [Thalassospira sp. HF15]NIY75434.1 N-acetyl sugar amidotransferase [Thalassospira sp. HF15]